MIKSADTTCKKCRMIVVSSSSSSAGARTELSPSDRTSTTYALSTAPPIIGNSGGGVVCVRVKGEKLFGRPVMTSVLISLFFSFAHRTHMRKSQN